MTGGRPAYSERWLGRRHREIELHTRRLLTEAQTRAGDWLRFYAGDADDAAMIDQTARYIIRQERPAQSVRVEWLRRDGTWADRFPKRPIDRWQILGRGPFPRSELAALARVPGEYGAWLYVGQLRLAPKRGTISPSPLPRGRLAADVLADALEEPMDDPNGW